MAVGFAYAYGTLNDHIKELLRENGIKYARTCNVTGSAKLPEDFLEWNPTAIETDKRIPDIINACIRSDTNELQLNLVFYPYYLNHQSFL